MHLGSSKPVRWARQTAADPGVIWRYGFAGVAVLCATVVRLAFNPVLGAQAPHMPFAFAVIIAALFGGRGPGLVATALSALSVDWYFLEPVHSRAIKSQEGIWGFALFTVTTALIALLVGSLRELLMARARAEQNLRRQAQLIDLAHDAIITTDSNRRIVTWNQGAEQMYGWPEREAVGKILHELLQTSGSGEVDATLRRERQWDGELGHTSRTSQRLTVESRQVLIVDEQNISTGILEINRDITSRKQAEEALCKSRDEELARVAELQAIMDAMPVAMFISRDSECRDVVGNQSAYELLQQPPRSNLSKSAPAGEEPTLFRLIKDRREIPPHELPLRKAAATGQPVWNLELELVLEDGSRRNIIGNAVPFLDDKGCPRGAVGTFVDITERKQNEERVRHAQKLESIGLLASGVAHDFNNLLTVIIGRAESALQKCPSCGDIRDIITASARAADLTKQLLAYAGKGRFRHTNVNLTDLVFRSKQLLSASIPNGVEVLFKLSEQELFIKADPSEIEQILMHLVVNASEAIPPQTAGRIEIVTRTCEVAAEIVRKHEPKFDARPGTFVCLEVLDNGTGMDEATLAQIFDPFFSTKFMGRGLGLSAVQGIVRGCNGFIDVRSSPGAGSEFRIFLPAAGNKLSEEVPGSSLPGGSRRDFEPATVLVVDGEELVRGFACATLRSAGFKVSEAKDGRDALEALTSSATLPSVVLIDLMSAIEGEGLLLILNRVYPGLRIIVTSSYREEEARGQMPSEAVVGFLQKPYSVATLAGKVKETLIGSGPNEEAPDMP